MNEQELEQHLKSLGLTAPRITPDKLDEFIKDVTYHNFPNTTLTICLITLVNGFTVTGESSSVSFENFDPEIGKTISFQNARNKIWSYAGYSLKDTLHQFSFQAKFDTVYSEVETIAMVAHETNRIWCGMNGDFTQPYWVDAPEWQKNSAINGVMFHMENPNAGDDASHNNWMAEKLQDGWKYGDVKDPDKKEHPCIVAFNKLPKHQQVKDALFRSTVHAMLNT